MSDSITDFEFRNASLEKLGESLARVHAEYSGWNSRAMLLAGFARDASTVGVSHLLTERNNQAIRFAEELGILKGLESHEKREIALKATNHQLDTADDGVKVAAIVILHNACEQFLYRLVRFGIAANRAKAMEWIAKRAVTIGEIAEKGVDGVIDDALEKWWKELERRSLLEKWDRLIRLFGYPSKLVENHWRFDREMLSELDDVRQNVVHQDGQKVKAFDLERFADQAQRAFVMWFGHIAQAMQLRPPAEVFWGFERKKGDKAIQEDTELRPEIL